MTTTSSGISLSLLLLYAQAAAAQEPCPCPPPPPPEPAWKGSLGVGLATTSGNTDTRSYNLGYEVVHDPKRRNVFRSDGLYLRSETGGVATASKAALGVRDEYGLGKRAFAFGEVRYLRDRFKGIRYLISPVAGLGYKLVERERFGLVVDAAVGLQLQGLEAVEAKTSGAVQSGESLRFKLSESARIEQRASGLWKMNDFGDAFYRVDAGLIVSFAKRFELKLADHFDYKTRPPTLPGQSLPLKKADNSIVVSLLYKLH